VAHQALRAGASVMQVLPRRSMRSRWWHLVIETNDEQVANIRKSINETDCRPHAPQLAELGITPDPNNASLESALELRKKTILTAEESLVTSLGLIWKDSTQ